MTRDWMLQAACAGHPNPDLWFPTSPGPAGRRQAAQAAAICDACPVKAECRAYQKATQTPFGVWGGRVYRSQTYGSTAYRPPLAHGTEGRYKRHLQEREPPCDQCRVAATRERARREANKKAAKEAHSG